MDIAHDPVAPGGATAASARQQNRRPREPSADAPKPSVSQFVEDIRAAFNARFYLFELEAKRAAWSAAYMLAMAVGAALLGITAWLILIGALIVGAVAVGVPWVVAVASAIALHALAVFFLLRRIRAMVDNLTFAATRRTLSNKESQKVDYGRA